jgi:hypothetical protein
MPNFWNVVVIFIIFTTKILPLALSRGTKKP